MAEAPSLLGCYGGVHSVGPHTFEVVSKANLIFLDHCLLLSIGVTRVCVSEMGDCPTIGYVSSQS